MTQDEIVTSLIHANDPTPLPKPAPAHIMDRSIMDLFSLKGKVCVVTGAARENGIGYAAAQAYCEAGCDVLCIWDYSDATETCEKLALKYGTKTKAYRVNVASSKNVAETTNAVVEEFGRIDVFVANAGVVWETGSILEDINDDDKSWHRVVDVDLNGVYYCAKNIGKVFKKQRSGSLVITASMSGMIVNVPNYQMPYNAAKAGCIHMAKSLGVEFSAFNARVNCVCPGYMDTGLSDFLDKKILNAWYQMSPMGRQGVAKELAGAYLYLASDASSFTTGSAMVCDGGFTCP
ncbi:hypothetical protein KL921_001499 [Ogataea angusta]|uniref:Uncharacterized protein n=1 Tax=Pichia angusta TaxID=870730 RepID=A0AAN6I5Y8_PICAN|nr:uncharacterized protein KL928_002735 [Ogataea angusta]KAG7812267.1 hypothetical protein KL921_001499 [Ogataea angusta]KAG7818867.1 hypothetical protein KL928_002735 [Ogataea angusta]KAG7825114.1 hypothetical protein KL909_001406 [Ogataea angusta]KAG7830300.1 hypothetical protein KL920_001938 [Ogataea angusta]KAG7834569.1 hypothetical protein KL943_002953 [Ogataea angusta]